MPAPVVIELYAPQPQPQELSVLLGACSRAAAPHECVTSDAKGAEAPLGVAIVRREGNRARIELGLRGGASAQWSTRDLEFQPGDDELERYRAIGFAVGTLVAREVEAPPTTPTPAETPPGTTPTTPPTSPSPASTPTPPPTTTPVARPAKPDVETTDSTPTEYSRSGAVDVSQGSGRARGAWLDAAGGVGLGLIPGPPRIGGALRAALELMPRGVFALAEGGYAGSEDATLRARWLSVAVGLGQPLAPNLKTLGVDVRLMFTVERVAFTAEVASESATAWRWKPGATVAIDGHWAIARPLSLVLTAATFIDPGHTVVLVSRESSGELPTLGLSGFFGLRLRVR